MYFIKIKKSFLLKPDSKKNILLLWYLFANEKRTGDIDFILNDMIKYYGYFPSNKDNGISSIFKKSLKTLFDENIIYSNNKIEDIKNDKIFPLKFSKNDNDEYSFLDIDSDYVIFNDEEFEKIIKYNNETKKKKTNNQIRAEDKKTSSCNIDNVIYIYLILKSFMNFAEQSYQFCFPSMNKLKTFSGLSIQSIKKALEVLEKLKMIYIYPLGKYITTKEDLSKEQTIYCLNNYEKELNALKTHFSSFKKDFKKWVK